MRSATTSAWSDDRGGSPFRDHRSLHNLAKGGVGLIVTGHLYVMDAGNAHVGMVGISNDYHIPMLRELVKSIHHHDSKIVAQLNHAGIFSRLDRAGPSEYVRKGSWKARALSLDEIHDVVEAFGDAAERAVNAGFDCVQIHGAHGYLISQFLLGFVNNILDEYGGNLKKRMGLLFEVYDEIRSRLGEGISLLLKMNCDDFSMNGFTMRIV